MLTALRHYREKRGLELEELARRLSTKPERVESWERGESLPRFRQLLRLAQVLHIPVGYLFFEEPYEVEEIEVADLRVKRQGVPFSDEFKAVLYDAQRKQEWLREMLVESGAEPLPFVGRFSIEDEPKAVAYDIKEVLRITPEAAEEAGRWIEYLRTLNERIEDAGILVLRNSVVGNNTRRKLDVEEFRGFALVDAYAPLIFVNSRDAIAAQIFTLIHELAHIWIGESAVSNLSLREPMRTLHKAPRVELFCNAVAAEFLVPEDSFKSGWDGSQLPSENASRLAKQYKVSELVVLRRALDLGFIDFKTFRECIENLPRERVSQPEGGDFYKNLLVRNSKRLVLTLLRRVREGRTTYLEAARLLNVNHAVVAKLMEKLEIR